MYVIFSENFVEHDDTSGRNWGGTIYTETPTYAIFSSADYIIAGSKSFRGVSPVQPTTGSLITVCTPRLVFTLPPIVNSPAPLSPPFTPRPLSPGTQAPPPPQQALVPSTPNLTVFLIPALAHAKKDSLHMLNHTYPFVYHTTCECQAGVQASVMAIMMLKVMMMVLKEIRDDNQI
ncbi:hypothetical protein E2C01_091592 [Portunus trituberculatus]|uniref:Uncharacterized protein n=1 Tax=Portunus trituberculatus TaxID=210409 RepID=A0A5B7JPT2_PORTR|nr:hypothetical protein [Portunus trituberculatus]